tara:strand:+ start:292 stop:1287 length:996 start_codon:yes stop_codon:yes gene_type:complete
MIKIIFKEGQGLGNQLWLFAVAKSISEKLEQELEIIDFKKFKGRDFLNLDYKEYKDNYLINNKSLLKNAEIFNERVFYDNELKYIVSSYDERVLSINKNTLLDGIFQSEKYFFGNLEKLKRYIKLDKKVLDSIKLNSKYCILNIRGGEYKRHKNFILPKKYWLNAMQNFRDKFNISNFKIVTDDFKYANFLFPELEIIHGDIGKCYAAIYKSRNIILSNSSFSYFPCKTGFKKKNIIAPMYWARPSKNNGRWISPGNVYKDWLWQDEKSNLYDYNHCQRIAEESDHYYRKEYTVLVRKNSIPNTGILNFLPKRFKKILKKILSHLFPEHFG